MATLTTTIRLTRELRDRLVALAADEGMSVAEVVEQAVAARERERFWDAVRADALAEVFETTTLDLSPAKDGLDPADTWDDVLDTSGPTA